MTPFGKATKKCPCINCITYVICKKRYDKLYESHRTNHSIGVSHVLSINNIKETCQLLEIYTYHTYGLYPLIFGEQK